MTDKQYNIIIIGCGMVIDVNHLPTLLASDQVKITALIDKNKENAFRLKKKYSIDCQVVDDIALVDGQVDGAIIATPNNSHVPIARECLKRDIPVFIEKPLCIKTQDAMDLCSLAKKRNLFISVSYWTRFLESNALMKELIDSNYFGKILSYDFEFGTAGGWAPVSGYNIDKEQCGGGVLMINGTHVIDRILYWFGQPDSLEYEDDSHGGVEANCKAKFYYDSRLGKFTGSIFFSKTVPLKNRFILHFDDCICEIKEAKDVKIKVYPKDDNKIQYEISRRVSKSEERMSPLEAQFDNFIRCIKGESKPTVDGDFATKSVALIEEMYKHKTLMQEPWVIKDLI